MVSKVSANERSEFVDELSCSVAWRLFSYRGSKKIVVLDTIKPSRRFLIWILRCKGIEIVEANFFAGHLRTAGGESVRRASRRESGQIALVAALTIVSEVPCLSTLNDYYGRNTIALHLAKHLHMHVEYWAFRSRVAQALNVQGRSAIWMKKPVRFDERFLVEYLPHIDYVFYTETGASWISLAADWLREMGRNIRRAHGISLWARPVEPVIADKPGVLALQEDQIRFAIDLRGQPHWLDRSAPSDFFITHILKTLNQMFCTYEEESRLSVVDVRLFPTVAF